MALIKLTPKEQKLNQLKIRVTERELATYLNVKISTVSSAIKNNWSKLFKENIADIEFVHDSIKDNIVYSLDLTSALWITELINKSQRPTLAEHILDKIIKTTKEQIQNLNKELLHLEEIQTYNN